MKNKTILNLIVTLTLCIFSISLVLGLGLSSDYWDGNPLRMNIGQTKDINFRLQNMVGSEDVVMKVEIFNENGIATIIDQSSLYSVPIGADNVKVNVRVSIPQSANIGDRYKVRISATSVASGGNQFKMSSAVEQTFEVLVVEKVEKVQYSPETTNAQNEAAQESDNNMTAIVIGILIILIIACVIIYLKKKNIRPKTSKKR